MQIDPEWKRIAAIHMESDGSMGAVWLAFDHNADCLHLYDASLFDNEVLAVIAEGLNSRGSWIPIAWEKSSEDIAGNLLNRGCRMIPEATKDTEELAEMISRDIQERQRTGRFKVDKNLAKWIDEFTRFYREEMKVPRKGYPLMAATRHAVANMHFMRRKPLPRGNKYRQIAMI